MKSTLIFIALLVAVVVGVLLYSINDKPSPENYIKEIEFERKEKDTFMRIAEDSPFKDSSEPYQHLNYFPADLKYRINATLLPIEQKKMIVLPTSDGKEKKYLENAYAQFELDGKTNKLLILEVTEAGPFKGTLYLAFADETSARETYGAGRYLELKKVPGSRAILLDFNKAYNPYCAYTDNFSCPFPPPENILKVAIKAGEKSYH